MITKKLHIESISEPEFVKEKQDNYSYAFRLLYKMLDESTSRDFIERFMERFKMNDIEYRSLCSDVKSFRKIEIKQKENNLKRIENIQKKLEKDCLSKKVRFKKHNTIAYLTKRLEHESAFGGLELQRKLTRECNKSTRDKEKIESLRQEFHDNRTLPFMIVGEANQSGNRFFDLSRINENIIIYKPYKGKKIELKVKLSNGYRKALLKVADMMKSKELSVTVSLKVDTIYITYDEERLNGYSVDEVSRRKTVKEIKNQKYPKEIEKSLIKETYREYFRQQEEKKLQGKIAGRAIAIDMNPTNLGFSILDKTEDGVKIIYCGQFDLSKICKKTGKSSASKESKYLTNKRHYEISIIVKELFKFAMHFQCSEFIIENLNFTEEGKENLNTESRRKTLNVWCRNKFEEYITRRCNETGITLVKTNACYTSFVGNIKYSYVDATNASIEIGRRGLHKYKKGMFYPQMTVEDIHTLEAKFGDVVDCSTDGDWVKTYKSLVNQFNGAEFSHRLRARLSDVKTPHETFSMNSCRSGIYLTIFH